MARRFLATLLMFLFVSIPLYAQEEITLVVWDWQGFRNDQLRPYAEEYSRLNPHIKFEFQVVALAQYPTNSPVSRRHSALPQQIHQSVQRRWSLPGRPVPH